MANVLRLTSKRDTIEFDPVSARILSFRNAASGMEFIDPSPAHPVFVMGWYDDKSRYRFLSSADAGSVNVTSSDRKVTALFTGVGGRDLDVTCTAECAQDDEFVSFRVSVDNRSSLKIADLQYPFVVCRYTLEGTPDSERALLPHGYGSGRLLKDMKKPVKGDSVSTRMPPDSWVTWSFNQFSGEQDHYPGLQFAQFLAYYSDRGGLYMACRDTQANVKRFRFLHRAPGMRMGVAHIGDWPENGSRELEYDTVLRTFEGDWYDAADIYREWSEGQSWFKPVYGREDVPAWLKDSPVYITLRPQGILDFGDVEPVDEFVPLSKCLPILEDVSKKVDSPLSVIFMGWERAGSWVYPDTFPPVGGDQEMADLIRGIREKGWHAGDFSCGTRWVVGQFWNGYDGWDYYDEHGGEESVCRLPDGRPWEEIWNSGWRPCFASCMAVDKTRDTARGYVGHLVGWGMDSIQFLDQNNGSVVLPCYADDHGHPPMPGKWMQEAMTNFMGMLHDISDKHEPDRSKNHVVYSAESGLNECCLPLFEQTELRIYPPGMREDVVPLYQYLYHECVILQGMMGNAPEPYHLALRTAANCVLGGIPGGVLAGEGRLLDKDTNNWAPWEPYIEESDYYGLIRAVSALRRGPGRDFLVFGRMMRPAEVTDVAKKTWRFEDRDNTLDTVFHTAWRSPGGKHGVVFANWTGEDQSCTVRDGRVLSGSARLGVFSAGSGENTRVYDKAGGSLRVDLPPYSCALVEEC